MPKTDVAVRDDAESPPHPTLAPLLSKQFTSTHNLLRTNSEPTTPGRMKDGHFYLLALADLQKWRATEQQMTAAKSAAAANDKVPRIDKYTRLRDEPWGNEFAVQTGAMFEADKRIKIQEAGEEDGHRVEWQFYRLKRKQYTLKGHEYLERECWVSNYPWAAGKKSRHATEFQGKDIEIRALAKFEFQARTNQLETAEEDFYSRVWFSIKMGVLCLFISFLVWCLVQSATSFDLTESWISPPPQNNGPEWDALCPGNRTEATIDATEWQKRFVIYTAGKGLEFRQFMRWQPSQKGLRFNRESRLTGVAREVGEDLVRRTNQAAPADASWFRIIVTLFINVHQYWKWALVSAIASYLLKEVASTIRQFASPYSSVLFSLSWVANLFHTTFWLSCVGNLWMYFHILPPARTVEMCKQFRECFGRYYGNEEPCCCPDFGEGTWISDLLSSANWQKIDAASLENTAWQRIGAFLAVTSQTNLGTNAVKAVKDFVQSQQKKLSSWAERVKSDGIINVLMDVSGHDVRTPSQFDETITIQLNIWDTKHTTKKGTDGQLKFYTLAVIPFSTLFTGQPDSGAKLQEGLKLAALRTTDRHGFMFLNDENDIRNRIMTLLQVNIPS
jgi:hypothetical protein